jgi:hypothetical protein
MRFHLVWNVTGHVTGEIEAENEDAAHEMLDTGNMDLWKIVEDHIVYDLEEIEPWPEGEPAPGEDTP